MKGKGYFIIGTDTGVGKTYFGATLAKALRERGVKVGVMKPVESGCATHSGELVPSDAVRLREASGSDAPLDLVNPYRFSAPIAPNIAARIEGKVISIERIDQAFASIQGSSEIILVEGAGGLLSPLTDEIDNAGLAARLGLELIIVAASRLGCINHTLLTISYAITQGLKIKGVVITRPNAIEDESSVHNRAEIERLLPPGVDLLGEVAYDSGPEELGSSLDIDGLL